MSGEVITSVTVTKSPSLGSLTWRCNRALISLRIKLLTRSLRRSIPVSSYRPLLAVELKDIRNLKIAEALNPNATLVAGGDLPHIVLEAPQT